MLTSRAIAAITTSSSINVNPRVSDVALGRFDEF
jgi:hypothetical protein